MEIKTTFVNIDSRKRQSGTAESLVFVLDHGLADVTKVELLHFSCYNTIYNVDQYSNQLSFTDTNGTFTITVAPGNYIESELLDAIQTAMNSASSNGYTLTYNAITMKTTISASSNFQLDFPITENSIVTVLGFLNEQYSGASSYTSPDVMDLGEPSQIHVYIRELESFFCGAAGSNDRPAFVVHVDGGREQVLDFNSGSHYPQFVELPYRVTLTNLTINLLTSHPDASHPPVPLNLNGSEYCMILKVSHAV